MNAASAIEIEDSDPLRLAFLEQSDLGNAERLKALAKGRLKWIEDLQLWAWYDGRCFDVERGAIAAQRLAHEVVRHIRAESAEIYALHDRCEQGEAEAHELLTRLKGPKYGFEQLKALGSGLLKHALKSGSASMTAGMLRQAKSDLAALAEDFDVCPYTYNVLNGTLRFVPPGSALGEKEPAEAGDQRAEGFGGRPEARWTVKFSPHDPADLLMQVADVEYAPDADCPFWTERLAMLTPDREQLAALQVLYGYTLTGLTSDQAFYVHQGKGGDGKSATHMALAELHGDYFRHSGVKSFLQGAERGGAEHRSDLVRLRGDIRFVTCDEPKARSVWDGETIKQVTGSLITARGSGAATEVTYKPRFKLFAECNVVPGPPSDDKGFRRRFKLYQWTVSLPEPGEYGHIPIDEVLEALRAERSGILNWMIAGALQWLERRVVPQPASMAGVLEDYWADASPLLDWIGEWCETSDKEVRSYSADLYASFKDFCERRGIEKVITATTFGTKLRNMQFAKVKDSKGLVQRRGIRLLSEAEHDARMMAGSEESFVGGASAPHTNPAEAPPGARAAEAASGHAPGVPRAAASTANSAGDSQPSVSGNGVPPHPDQPDGLDDDAEDLP